MNDGTNIASDDIILKPKFRYWLMKNFLLITLAIFVFIFSKYIREHELLKVFTCKKLLMTKKKLPVRFTGQHFTIDKVLIKMQ